jgi:putative PIN family toxin of toxin-antitoxin system
VIVVLDTNVWVSALEFGGTPDRALFRALTQDQLAISDFIRGEIVRVLTGKFDRDPLELGAQLDELLAYALTVEVTGEISGICRGPLDNAILETAWKARADCLIAGDKDLLILGPSFRGIAIVSPAVYLETPLTTGT